MMEYMREKKSSKRIRVLMLILLTVLVPAGCGNAVKSGYTSAEDSLQADSVSAGEEQTSDGGGASADKRENTYIDEKAPEIKGLTYSDTMELSYAEGFRVDYYEEGYKIFQLRNGDAFILVPEGKEAPEDTEGYQILYAPLDHIYMAATSAMSLFDAIDAADAVTMTGTQQQGWYIDAPREAMKRGDMIYAGKYSSPDYEMLILNECDAAIESSMIFHTPEVQEMLRDLDIPVFVDQSSYEKSSLGRSEWIRLYGAMMDREDEAAAYFEEQSRIMDEVSGYEETGKTVAYFSVNSDGSCVIRRPEDYVSEMIRKGGGEYVFDSLKETDGNAATITISMEEFYSKAADCDYLIYNSTIEGGLRDKEELIGKNALFGEFSAVRKGNLWQVNRKMYQSTDKVSQFIRDVHIMLTDGDEAMLTFLEKVR